MSQYWMFTCGLIFGLALGFYIRGCIEPYWH